MMSERGKYWNPEKYGAPVSVGRRSVDSDRPTIKAPETLEREKTTEEPIVQEKSVEQVRDSWRATKLLSIAWVCGVLGVGVGTGYMYHTKQGPFAPDEKVEENDTTPQEKETDKYETPLIIENDEDLRKALKKEGIKARPKDFDFDAGKSGLHAKAIRLVPIAGNEKLNVPESYYWEPVTKKIETDIDGSQVLVAVQLINQFAQSDAGSVVNSGPHAHEYIARTPDADDPNIVYFYFDRCMNTERSNALARIRIQHPSNRNKHIWYRSFDIPQCNNNFDGVESDAPIQQ